MKTVIYENYGSPEVLKVIDIEKPVPGKNDILIKIKSSSVSAGVRWIRMGKHHNSEFFSFMIRLLFGFKKPKYKQILGFEFSGEVESVGSNVHSFKIGDKIFGTTTGSKHGAYAEYLCLPEKMKSNVIAIMAESISFEEAAVLPIGGMTSLYLLKKAALKKDEKILIYGASGSVGTYAVQIAKYFGANITGVCGSSNLELIRNIGADNVIDYTKTDIFSISEKYDVIFDAVGKISKNICKNIMNKNSRYITVNSPTDEKIDYLNEINELFSNKKVRPIIDRIYSLDEIVEAHRYVDTGHKKGNVVIKMC